ncbi:MAG: hypothetical protein OEP48_09720 [Betaproteobacteria bacterium]|nr:hypothetical protein [Betaproteobacteria bacterium]MDH3435465.1 hypothetical protein [Betaproteobacteria bacterium]
MRTGHRALAVLVSLFLLAGGPVSGAAAAQPQSDTNKDWQLRVNSTARLIAGLVPTHPDHRALAERPDWKAHSAKLRASWAWLRDQQIAPLTAWRNGAVPPVCPVGSTLLYPFSGPDFFNAYWLFPNCEAYVLFGLEPIGSPPAIETMSDVQLARLLTDVREAMANLLARNYFVTSRMDKQMQAEELNGVVPIIMISMALAGIEVLRIAPLTLGRAQHAASEANAESTVRPRRKLKGVTIEFRRLGAPVPQRLNYFSVDASNAGIARNPQFRDYLRGLAPTTTLIKSASYLLHVSEFKRLRHVLLDVSGFLVQDDTGVPYAMLAKRGWQLTVYGRYEVPIPPFERHYQPDLAEAFVVTNPQPLSFRFGYRRSIRDDRSNVMVAQRTLARRLGPDKDAAGASAPAQLGR